MSWVGRVTRRRLALSKSGAGSSGKKNLAKSRDQTKHVTRGIEHVGKNGAKGNLDKISHSGSHWRTGSQKIFQIGSVERSPSHVWWILSKAVKSQAPEATRLTRFDLQEPLTPRDEGADPGDA